MTSDAMTDATTSGATTGHLLRIERGRAEPEELAALMAVLLARTAASGARGPRGGGADRGLARWRRLDPERGFGTAGSWRNAA